MHLDIIYKKNENINKSTEWPISDGSDWYETPQRMANRGNFHSVTVKQNIPERLTFRIPLNFSTMKLSCIPPINDFDDLKWRM